MSDMTRIGYGDGMPVRSVLGFCCLFILASCCQLPGDSFLKDAGSVRSITVRDGLSGGNIRSIVQADDKTLWFATDGDGVSCYNGESFETLDQSDGLPNLFVRSLIKSRAGNIWAGIYGGGICRFQNHKVVQELNEADGLVSDFVNTLCEDAQGNIWIGTREGISRFDGKSLTNFSGATGPGHDHIRSSYADAENRVWFGTEDGRVIRFEGDSFEVYQAGENRVYAFLQDAEGMIWAGTFSGLFQLRDGEFRLFDFSGLQTDQTPVSSAQLDVNSMFLDSSGRVWIGSTQLGAIAIQGDYYFQLNFQNGLAGNRIYAIQEDHEGNLWFGTWGDGVSMLDPSIRSHFHANRVIVQGLESEDGATWFLAQNGEVIRLKHPDYESFQTGVPLPPRGRLGILKTANAEILACGDGRFYRFSGAFPPETVSRPEFAGYELIPLIEDSAGNVWFDMRTGGQSRKVLRYSKSSTSVHSLEEARRNLAEAEIIDVLEDASGALWFATKFNGVFTVQGDRMVNHDENEGLVGEVTFLLRDSDDHVWIGLQGNDVPSPDKAPGSGLIRFDGREFKPFSTTDGLASNSVACGIRSSDGSLWFGTWHGGLSLYRNGRFKTFTALDGLAGGSVTWAAEGSDGRLWFSSPGAGVSIHDGANFQIITSDDGLLSDTAYPFLGTGNQKMWIRYYENAGLTEIQPPRAFKPLGSIHRVFADQVFYSGGRTTLEVKGDNLAVDFRGLSYKTPAGRMKFQYSLTGADVDWKSAAAKDVVEYAGLSPGRYRLSARAIDRHLNYSEPQTLEISVLPPWHRKPAVVVPVAGSIALFLAAFGMTGFKYVHQKKQSMKLRKEKEDLRESMLNQERRMRIELEEKNSQLLKSNSEVLSLLRIVGHDIMNQIFCINASIDIHEHRKQNDSSATRKSFSAIQNSAERIRSIVDSVRNMRQIEDGKKALTLIPFPLARIRQTILETFDSKFSRKNLELRFEPNEIPEHWAVLVEPTLFTNTVLSNLISNAIKFSYPDSVIRMVMEEKDEWFEISIIDSGMGIPKDMLEMIFRTDVPTTRAGTNDEKGTGFGMPLVKKYMESMQGAISIQSVPEEESKDHGTKVTLLARRSASVAFFH